MYRQVLDALEPPQWGADALDVDAMIKQAEEKRKDLAALVAAARSALGVADEGGERTTH